MDKDQMDRMSPNRAAKIYKGNKPYSKTSTRRPQGEE